MPGENFAQPEVQPVFGTGSAPVCPMALGHNNSHNHNRASIHVGGPESNEVRSRPNLLDAQARWKIFSEAETNLTHGRWPCNINVGQVKDRNTPECIPT